MTRPEAKTLAGVVSEYAAITPTAPAIFGEHRVLSYRELDEEAADVALALAASGIQEGDRLALLMGNDPEWVVIAIAASRIGAVLCPLNTWYKKAELAWTLRHSKAKFLISVPNFLKTDYVGLFAELREEGDLPELVFTSDAPGWATSWRDFIARAAGQRPAQEAASPDTAAFVLYTSGSTADPKGVLLNHRGVVENGWEMGARRGINAEDRVWLGSPLFYGLGATNALPSTFTHGASLVLQGHFEAGRAIETIAKTEATVFYGTGNMTRGMLDHPDFTKAKVGSLSKGNAGTVAEYKRLTLIEMGITGAVPAYGLTESYGNATVGEVDDPLEAKLNTSGRPLPGMELLIVDPASFEPLAQGETGLVLLRGHTTPGYLDNPVETAKALRQDGYFDTGDLGSLDADGRFIFHSRLKEVIKSGGINVSPVEVEQLIAQHPDVRDAYVVGVGDPVRGELIVAFVDVLGQVGENDIKAYVKERAASFKVPHHVMFREERELPRLASGKVAKHKLAEEARTLLSGSWA
ncbi:class I adenylate-forming enzyme family protein [Parvularcula marina]|uniref:Long-chain fatty acid--CoA ligase n=1 Tax=Parvularcula marina TaxID=2292771 RepID=A0A371RLD2_9PROT|nr:class I adenylate-forming enzyme family protein [Parvularcula marina]RFB06254.1 long-chain fatty acid--CoA ligase [Parvularcula marina]